MSKTLEHLNETESRKQLHEAINELKEALTQVEQSWVKGSVKYQDIIRLRNKIELVSIKAAAFIDSF